MLIDFEEFQDTMRDDEDEKVVLYYLRKYHNAVYKMTSKMQPYRDNAIEKKS